MPVVRGGEMFRTETGNEPGSISFDYQILVRFSFVPQGPGIRVPFSYQGVDILRQSKGAASEHALIFNHLCRSEDEPIRRR